MKVESGAKKRINQLGRALGALQSVGGHGLLQFVQMLRSLVYNGRRQARNTEGHIAEMKRNVEATVIAALLHCSVGQT